MKSGSTKPRTKATGSGGQTAYIAREFPVRLFGALTRESVQTHQGLYEGYVKQVNELHVALRKERKDVTTDPTRPQESLARRLAFETSGVVLHELFFEQYLPANTSPGASSPAAFSDLATRCFGSLKRWQANVMDLSATRGSGWIVTAVDPASGVMSNFWADLHHLSLPAGARIVFALDLWEHAYWLDYGPKAKTTYVEDALTALSQTCLDRRTASL